MRYVYNFFIIFAIYTAEYALADNADTVKRNAWKFEDTDTIQSSVPSNLKYYKSFELLPDEINFKIFNKQDLSHLAGKKLYVGYGIADQKGEDCKIFPAAETGQAHDITVCLPWWRMEREYKRKKNTSKAMPSFLDGLKVPRAPMTVNYCKEYADGKEYPGGKATCTTYFDRNAGGDCWDNPEQAKCFVDNCGIQLKNKCEYIDSAVGNVDTLPSSVLNSTGTPESVETKVKLTTHRYTCPSGPIAENVECVDEKQAIMFPYECKEDDVATLKDDGEYIYCDEQRPVFDVSGNIESFLGTCSDGTEVTCQVNKFKNTVKVCTQPIYETEIISEIKGTELVRGYTERTVDVLSGEADIYSADESCLRSNTVDQAREQELYVKIIGTGALDDDIYVLRHKADGSHTKVYCNMQHNGNNGSKKSYNGDVLACLANNGSYSFSSTVGIEVTDIVSVQQNSENENESGAPFSLGRQHYGSTKVVIDNIEVAPSTFSNLFPHYPSAGQWLKTWDNTNSTLSILFPFAGAYELFFYNKSNEEIAKATLDIEDFKEITQNGSLQLKLGRTMELANNIPEENANREDMWVEWGGGVYGGKDSITGTANASPNDSYVKDNAVTNIIAKDLLTGAIVPIPLTYPMPYPNRVFISKLKVYEYRKYRCYDDFAPFSVTGQNSSTRSVCTNTSEWDDYTNNLAPDVGNLQQWEDNALCEQNCRSTYTCSAATEGSLNGFKCSERGGENIGGDLSGNLFSSKDTCDAACWIQSPCANYTESNCNIIEEQNSEPISDYTGKTLYRKKSISYKCENRVDTQIGCAEYDVRVSEGDLNYGFTAVGYESKDYSGSFEEAVTKAQMLEVGQQHIFSGWPGKCVQGKKWDFSYLSDPMTIISYAMSAYQSMDYMADLNPDGWASDMRKSFESFTDSISEPINEAMSSVAESTIGETSKAAADNVSGAIKDVAASGGAETANNAIATGAANANPNLSALKNLEATAVGGMDNVSKVISETYNPITGLDKITQPMKDMFLEQTGIDWDATFSASGTEFKYGDYINVTNGDLVTFGGKAAYLAASPSEQDYITADRLLKGYVGINTEEGEVHNYNACMASIGASLPNLIGWSVDSSENSSSQLIAPWRHPLRMTPVQLASISTVTSEKYVTSQYLYENVDNILLSVVAITPQAYLKATQVICMGTKVAQAASHIETENNKNNPIAGMLTPEALAKMAVSMACPPCGFAMTVVMDLMSNVFAKIDTCNDETDAMQWGMLDYKTNKFQNQEQCHYVKTECDKKVNFGFSKKCVRERKEYCCYDQITTKVFAEGLKAQLNKGWDSCSDIEVDDLKDISFRECRDGEIPHINKCIPTESYSEFQQVIMRQASKNLNSSMADGLIDQAKQSMSFMK